MSWHRIRLSKLDVESGEIDIVRAVFRGAFVMRNGPRGAALYGRWADGGDSYLLYFSPLAGRCSEALFKVYAAEPCEPPDPKGLEWLYGDPSPPARYALAF